MSSEKQLLLERRLLVEAVREYHPHRFPDEPPTRGVQYQEHSPFHNRLLLVGLIPLAVLLVCLGGLILTELLGEDGVGIFILVGGSVLTVGGILWRVFSGIRRALRVSCPRHGVALVKPKRADYLDLLGSLPCGVWAIILEKPYRLLCPYAVSRFDFPWEGPWGVIVKRYCPECEAKRVAFTEAFFKALDGAP